MPTAEEVNWQKVLRSRFLDKLYDMAAKTKRGNGRVDVDEIVRAIDPSGINEHDVARIIRDLALAGLIEAPRSTQSLNDPYPRIVSLTDYGTQEVERWVQKDSEPTSQIPVAHSHIYNINVESAQGTQFVMGSTNTTINAANQFGPDLNRIATNLRVILDQADLSADQREDLEDDVSILEEQASISEPSASRINRALRRVRSFLGELAQAGQAGIAVGVTHETQQLVADLMGQVQS